MDDIGKYKKIKNVKILKKIEKPKSCGSLDVNDRLRNFEEANVVNVKSKSAKPDKPILGRIEPDPPRSLRDHFYPS